MIDYTLTFKNKDKILSDDDFKKYKDIVKYVILECLKQFEFPVNIDVIFTNLQITDSKIDILNKTLAMVRRSKKRYKLFIGVEGVASSTIQGLEGSVFHEIAHIYDMLSFENIGITQIFQNTFYTFDDYFLDFGYNFWTEYYAYYLTFRQFNAIENFTFYKLVCKYKKMKKINAKFNEKRANTDFVFIKDFIYYCAAFMASFHAKALVDRAYCKKTLKDKDFIFVRKFINGTVPYLLKLRRRSSKKQAKLLIKLGKYLFKKLLFQFDYALRKIGTGKVQIIRFY